jgi:hypothetical protein
MLSILLSLLSATPIVMGLSSPTDTAKIRLPVRVEGVRDLRALAKEDPRLLGVTEIGLFEQRTALMTEKSVADEVDSLVQAWVVPDSGALPVRLELLSLESWPVVQPGPDPVRSHARIRLVSLDSAKPGVLLTPDANAENKGFESAEDQMSLVRGNIRDALSMLRGHHEPVPEAVPAVAPEPDSAADPRRIPVQDSVPNSVQHDLWVSASPSFQTESMALRYSQRVSPQAGWALEYWTAVQFRGIWNGDRYSDVWAGEILGGQAWSRRLDDGRGPWALMGSLGGLLGTESFRRVYPDSSGKGTQLGHRTRYWYTGGQARGGVRWDVEGGWIAEAGLQLDVRIPSVIAWFDPGAYLQIGWQF